MSTQYSPHDQRKDQHAHADTGPSPLVGLPGAIAAPGGPGTSLDSALAWHYGDPLGEQRAATTGPIFTDQWNTETLRITGADRLTWLHSITSQHFLELAEHAGEQDFAAPALILSPQGHIEHAFDVSSITADNAAYLRCEPGTATPLAKFLASMIFHSDVEITNVTADIASVTVTGRDADHAVHCIIGTSPAPAGFVISKPDTSLTATATAPVTVRSYPDRYVLTTQRGSFAALATALISHGARPAGTWAAAARRIERRQPRFTVDSDHRTIPNETPWLATAVHLNKGCYRGQETVARVDNIGLPPRRTVLLNLDGSGDNLPSTGDPVTNPAGRTVGRVGTVAQHWEDGPIALAMIKQKLGPDTPLTAGGVDAAIDPDDIPATAPTVRFDRKSFYRFK